MGQHVPTNPPSWDAGRAWPGDDASWRKELDRVVDPSGLMNLLQTLGAVGRTAEGGVTRTAFSSEDVEARRKMMDIMSGDLGLAVSIDPWGNIIGRRPGSDPDAPVLMTGSHLDSVRNGGIFDGPAGVTAGYEAVRVLNQWGHTTRHPLELVVFCAEEPNHFGMATIGSRGMTGELAARDLQGLKDEQGRDLFDALAAVGGDPDNLALGVRRPGDIRAFLELHIEQMPYLEQSGRGIGVVEGVTGITRYRHRVRGQASHAGTTPMDRRHDALAAAAELITALYSSAWDRRDHAVATAGGISVQPNSVNTIPGSVVLDSEARSYRADEMAAIFKSVEAASVRVHNAYGVDITSERTYYSEPTAFSPRVRRAVQTACGRLGCEYMALVSMAGHDAKHLSRITEAGMIFIPCRRGLSHCPEEWAEPSDLAAGAKVLLTTLLEIDRSPSGDK